MPRPRFTQVLRITQDGLEEAATVETLKKIKDVP